MLPSIDKLILFWKQKMDVHNYLTIMLTRAQIHGSAYRRILRLRPIDLCTLQGSVSTEFCGKQCHEIGSECPENFLHKLFYPKV